MFWKQKGKKKVGITRYLVTSFLSVYDFKLLECWIKYCNKWYVAEFLSVLQRFVAVLNSFVLLKSLGCYILSYEDVARLPSKISNKNYCLYLVYIQMLSVISWPFPEEGFTVVVLFRFLICKTYLKYLAA